jgi:hypothetical protein
MDEDSRRESSAWFNCKSSERERITHLQYEVWGVKGRYAQARDALRAGVPQESHNIFFDDLLSGRGGERAIGENAKGEKCKVKFAKSRNRKIEQTEKPKS